VPGKNVTNLSILSSPNADFPGDTPRLLQTFKERGEGPATISQEQIKYLSPSFPSFFLGVKPSTIKKWVHEKKIPFVKFGKR
jgi:hypothetical protein